MRRVCSSGLCGLLLCLMATIAVTATAAAQSGPCPELDAHPRVVSLRQELLASRIEVSPSPDRSGLSLAVPSTIDLQTSRHWSAYRGGKPLSEPVFFEICGLHDEARKSRAHYASAERRIKIWKVGVWVGSLAWITGAIVGATSDDAEWPLPVLAVGIVATGGSWYLGHKGFEDRYRSWASYARAMDAADEHNAALCASLADRE